MMFKNDVTAKRINQGFSAPSEVINVPKLEYTLAKETKELSESVKIMNKIQQSKALFERASANHTETISFKEAHDYLLSQGLKKKQRIGRKFAPRPCFHPSGKSIVTIHKNRLQETTLPAVPEFKISDVISSHLDRLNAEQIQSQMGNLQINEADVPMYEANAVQDSFEDHWFRSLLNTDLPQISFFNNQR